MKTMKVEAFYLYYSTPAKNTKNLWDTMIVEVPENTHRNYLAEKVRQKAEAILEEKGVDYALAGLFCEQLDEDSIKQVEDKFKAKWG
jgi:hypothetical protein